MEKEITQLDRVVVWFDPLVPEMGVWALAREWAVRLKCRLCVLTPGDPIRSCSNWKERFPVPRRMNHGERVAECSHLAAVAVRVRLRLLPIPIQFIQHLLPMRLRCCPANPGNVGFASNRFSIVLEGAQGCGLSKHH
jgi:hypothetical protein